MDRAIGTLRQHLAANDLRDNTLIFYCGDNGTSPDATLGFPHRGVKGQMYEGGILVPGLIEWPARIPQQRTTNVRATTSDLLPTLCAITRQALPSRPMDGVDLSPLLDGKMTDRPKPLYFWEYSFRNVDQSKPYIDPALQEGTTPLAKKSSGKATRDFTNFHHARIAETDYLGPRAIIDGSFKLVIQDSKKGESKHELFDLKSDPAEKTNLIDQQPFTAERLELKLRDWQKSTLESLTGADYSK
jgi:arylsulfatase A-like enzyme